ncbi:FAD-dependent oxidoreductase [filamentous cyanobacterium LEGE 11480]|uniref:FAD-dependent oxidoreductase n=1 Tax=Romeriopsis navalis LEGE 11480 TaxID=2777977 RepID=A0A928VN09_9CYAN|nr:FAD-dependent oxidoreductase [Romeriopsis navalis]MBE9030683.1 FAD-dependent oxidoreductase [Romeriopsis navalis LEGE 11480]
MVEPIKTEVLVVGGGTGGTAAAIQAARRGAQTVLVSEFDWLGGMLTSAGVTAPDGNELEALQTGIWGAFLGALRDRQPGGLDNAWVSCFTYDAKVGAAIFAEWVAALPNLRWITGQRPQAVSSVEQRITGVTFPDYAIQADVTIDGTELGELLALGDIPHRWGWELKSEFNEPSAPDTWNQLTATYPIQVPTWVVVMQDFGEGNQAPPIPAPLNYNPARFHDAWSCYGGETFLNYGRLPGDRFMINWPIHGNDYGEGVDRLLGNPTDRQAFHQEALWHSLGFAHLIQTTIDQRYGLALGSFPWSVQQQQQYDLPAELLSAFALHPYHRESRRIVGLKTVREQDLLPVGKAQKVAALPIATSASGCENVEADCDAIAMGNYVLDHHYPSGDIALSKKSMQWGGRWTGTPFTIPYRSLVPQSIDGFLACEKNIAVTHLANGATRLQPLVLGIGQAAGMAAALCVEQQCQPRQLAPRDVQTALLQDKQAPAGVIPLLNQRIRDHQWAHWQNYYLDHPESYPNDGNAPTIHSETVSDTIHPREDTLHLQGIFRRLAAQKYSFELNGAEWQLISLSSTVQDQLSMCLNEQKITLSGQQNFAGKWILVTQIHDFHSP